MRTSFKNEKLTSRSIQVLKPKDRRYTIAVDKGLALRVQPSGTKSWVLRIPINGRVIDITLGHFPDLGLQQAKAEARKRQKSFDIDPIKSYTHLHCGARQRKGGLCLTKGNAERFSDTLSST